MELEGSLQCSQNPPVVPVQSQMNSVRNTQSYLSEIHLNIILSPTSRSS
jgi:hypothetical protein